MGGMVQSARLALLIANCTTGKTFCYLAQINKNFKKNWQNISLVVIINVSSSTYMTVLFPACLC